MGRGIYSISFVLMVLVPCIFGCSQLKYGARAHETGDDYDSDDRKVYYSEVVVFGEIGETVTGDYPYKGIKGVSTIKFNVHCTYKAENGPEPPSTIFIAGMGNENGKIKHCPPAPIPSGEKGAVMFLKRTDKPNVFEVEFKPNTHGVEIMLDDLSVVCGLTLGENASPMCNDYEPLTEEDGCVKWTPKNVTRPTEAPEPEETPEPEPKEENNTDDTVVDIDATEDGKNNQSDQGYDTKPETNKKTGSNVGSATDDENSSSTIVTSILVTVVSLFLTIVV